LFSGNFLEKVGIKGNVGMRMGVGGPLEASAMFASPGHTSGAIVILAEKISSHGRDEKSVDL
jgi:hypothetical protein